MKRTFFAGLLALLAAQTASAQCMDGSCGASVIPSAAGHQYGYPAYLGCGGLCFNLFGRMHQEGPLFNYGPYSGYYPFAPYGPWDSNLCYNDPNGAGCGGGRCGNGLCGRGGANSVCGWNSAIFHRLGRGGLGGGLGNCGAGGCGTGLAGRLGGLGGGFGGFGGLGSGLGGGCGAGGCGGDRAWGNYAMSTFRGVFGRCHPCANRAKISTGSYAAPASACGDCAGGVSVASASELKPASAEAAADPVYGNRVYRER